MRPSMGLFPTPHHHATLITLDCNVLHHLEALANEIVRDIRSQDRTENPDPECWFTARYEMRR